MGAENDPPVTYERKEIDDRILDHLADGRDVPSNIADDLDVSRQYIQQRLQLLEAAENVNNIGRGVYELIDDPREDVEQADDEARQLREMIAALQDERDHLQDDLEEAHERIEELEEQLRQAKVDRDLDPVEDGDGNG